GRNVTQQQKEAEERTKVQSGACSEFKLLYRGGWREGQLAWVPQPDRYLLLDCHKHQVGRGERRGEGGRSEGTVGMGNIGAQRQREEWVPQPDRYMLLDCHKHQGQLAWVPQPDRYMLLDCHKLQLLPTPGSDPSSTLAPPLSPLSSFPPIPPSSSTPPSSARKVLCMRHSMIAAGMLNRTLVVPMSTPLVPIAPTFMPHLLVRCMRHSMIAAGMLNRTLVVPMRTPLVPRHYDRRAFLHLPHTHRCYGPLSVISWEDLLGRMRAGPIDTRAFTNLSALIRPSSRIIVLGDLAAFNLEGPRGMDVPFFTLPGCGNTLAIHPHPAILEAADRFIRGVILGGKRRWWEDAEEREAASMNTSTAADDSKGKADSGSNGSNTSNESNGSGGSSRASNRTLWAVGDSAADEAAGVARYIAVHWRRTDLVQLSKDPWVHLPVARVGACLVQRMRLSGNITRMFLATDTDEGEVSEWRVRCVG
ncbi:unnamed protein product, partial [Closterium sp. Naga37s-1]